MTLHITNGDCAAEIIRQAVKGEVLPWRDVLHEGPVRGGPSLEALSRERAAFIADCGWGEPYALAQDFQKRDAALGGSHEEVVLWFEHDLYDQLQLIQLLDWFSAHPHPNLSLVCEAEYLGTITPARAAELFAARSRVSAEQLGEGKAAWAAFTASDPLRLEQVPCSHLRFLGAALRRHLEEFPWVGDGLSRTERAVLVALRSHPMALDEIFARVEEEPRFLGNAVLAWHLQRMPREGLVAREGERWAAVARPERSRLPRWLGGALVTGESPWRWDPARGAIRAVR